MFAIDAVVVLAVAIYVRFRNLDISLAPRESGDNDGAPEYEPPMKAKRKASAGGAAQSSTGDETSEAEFKGFPRRMFGTIETEV